MFELHLHRDAALAEHSDFHTKERMTVRMKGLEWCL